MNQASFPRQHNELRVYLGISRACVDTAIHSLFLAVANRVLTSTYTFYIGSIKKIVHSKPIISSTVGFRVNPGGEQQGLHRDCTDFHTRPCGWPMLINA
jgi:hypothetical protein